MSSYSKRKMQEAAAWLAINPDPADPFVRVPFEPRPARPDYQTDIAKMTKLAADKRVASDVADPLLAKLTDLYAQIETAESELATGQAKLEAMLNAPPAEEHSRTSMAAEYDGRWLLKWARDGYNTFELSPDFTAAMLLTDHREVEAGNVRLPFRGMLILLPDGFVRSSDGGCYTKIHISEISSRDLQQLRVAGRIGEVLGPMHADHQAKVLAEVANRPLSMGHVGRSLVEELIDTEGNGTLDHLMMSASDGTSSIRTTIRRAAISWDGLEALPESVALEDIDRDALITIWRIVFSAFAYIGAVEHGAEQRPAQKHKRSDTEPVVKHWDVGRTIKLGPQLIRAAREGSREVALRLKHRHIVRGHYRNQPHGEGRRERKKIWITPFWKGPEEGAALVHTYKLDDAEPAT